MNKYKVLDVNYEDEKLYKKQLIITRNQPCHSERNESAEWMMNEVEESIHDTVLCDVNRSFPPTHKASSDKLIQPKRSLHFVAC